MGIALRRGREFNDHDEATSAAVVIINESMAKVLWPQYPNGTDPIGQRLLIGIKTQPVEVVGVVADVLQAGRDQAPNAAMYKPHTQLPIQSVMLAVRTDGNPLSFVNTVRSQVSAIRSEEHTSELQSRVDI